MRIRIGLASILLASVALPALADSVAVGSGPGGTVVVNGRPCRVVTSDNNQGGNPNTTTITTGAGGLSGSTTAGPGGTSVTMSPGAGGSSVTTSGSSGSSVTVGSGASSGTGGSSAAAGSDCVIVRPSNPDQNSDKQNQNNK